MRARESDDGYDYVCTHVDDFKIIARDPEKWLTLIRGAFLVKSFGSPSYYLGNNYFYDEAKKLWKYGATAYTADAIKRVEALVGCLPNNKTPLPTREMYPEMDVSPLLDEAQHRIYQMLLGMAQWLVVISRPDLVFSCSSLSRFGACPREGHMDLMKHVWGFIKAHADPTITIDSRDFDFSDIDIEMKEFDRIDFLEDYPDAKEEVDPGFPKAYGSPLQITVMVDADHAHDKKTRKSLTGLYVWVGRTIVQWVSKRQSSIASSTYAAEFAALRHGTEEAIAMRYILRSFGIPIPADGSCPTRLYGDNFSVITNAQNPEADLHKKHVAISFHVVREAIAAGIIKPYWKHGSSNISDIATKQIDAINFRAHYCALYDISQVRRQKSS